MSTNTVSRLPSRLPAKSAKSANGTSTEQQQKTLTMPSKLQKGLVKTNLKPPSAGINNSPNILSSTTQLPQITTTSNTQIASIAATTNLETKLRPPNIDVTNKTSPVSSLLPSKKSNVSSSSITNNLKSPTKSNSTTQKAKSIPPLKRKSDDIRTQFGRNARAAPLSQNRKSLIKTPKSISKNLSYRKKATTGQQQSRISMRNSTNSTTSTRKNNIQTENVQLLVEIEKLRAENDKLHAEKKELIQEKGLLTVDVCQMEYRLACEESRVIELEVDVADLRSLLNGKHDKLDNDRSRHQSELDIANNLIMEQATTMSDQQSLIEELMTQLDEQERMCQNLQNVIDTFKTKHNILGDLKDILNLPDTSVQSNIEGIKAN